MSLVVASMFPPVFKVYRMLSRHEPCKAKECLAQTSQGWWPNNGDTMADLSQHPRAHHISKFPNALRNNFPQNGHFHIAVHGKGETGTSRVQTNFITTFICPHCVCCKIENALRVYVWSIQNMSRAFPLKGRDGKWQVFMLLTITNRHEEPIKQTKLSLFILTSVNEYHQRLAMEI